MITPLLFTLVALAVISLLITPKRGTVSGFYEGADQQGKAPSLITLVFSQVTTWIFARSLLTAAILGFYYGVGGAIAYTAYYLSFFTGAVIVGQIRFRHGFNSVQAFLTDRFGPSGTSAYNVVVALRVLSGWCWSPTYPVLLGCCCCCCWCCWLPPAGAPAAAVGPQRVPGAAAAAAE